jgi:hypothetical protein
MSEFVIYLNDFEIFMWTNKYNILENSIICNLLHTFLLFREKNSENFNIIHKEI